MDLVHQHAARKLADQRRQRPDAQRQTEILEAPAVLRQPDDDERAETGLNSGSEKIQAVQAEPASHGVDLLQEGKGFAL